MRRFAVIGLALAAVAPAATLRITAPPAGTVVVRGSQLTVTVEVDGGSYRSVAIIGEDPIGFGPMLAGPPYRFTIAVPADAKPGRYYLTAVGLIERDKFDSSKPVSIVVEPAARPVRHRVEPSTRLELEPGDILLLRVVGIFADGAEVDVTESSGTTYESDTPRVATIGPTGVVTAIAPGTARLRICGAYTLPVLVRAAH